MSAEQVTIVPSALELSFGDRITEAVTKHNLHVVERNLKHQGVLTFLKERVGASAIECPWSAFAAITDSIVAAEVESAPNLAAPGYFTTHIKFGSDEGRDTFASLYRRLLLGVGDPNMPELDRDGRQWLVARNFSYADASTGGRVGQIFFNEQYAEQRQNLRVLNGSMSTVRGSHVAEHLPATLQQRLGDHEGMFGAKVGESLLTTGQLGIVGRAMRDELAKQGLPQIIQRPRDNRPAVEKGATFKAKVTKDETGRASAATSVSGLGVELGQQASAPFRELWEKFKEREWASLIREGLGEATGGFGLMQVGEAIARVGVTAATRALGPAIRSTVADAIARHRQKHE